MNRIDKDDKRFIHFSEQQSLEEEWTVATGVHLEVIWLDEVEGSLSHHLHIRQEAGSCLTLLSISQRGDVEREVWVDQQGDDCETTINGVGIGRGQEHLSFTTHLRHQALRGTSHQLYKYVLADQAVGNFFGELVVTPGAQKTEAQQTNRNLLLSSLARVNTKPQLEIYADDVKCSHGASTGQLDEQALFYMQQRGIPREEARHLMIEAFAQEVIPEDLRERIRI